MATYGAFKNVGDCELMAVEYAATFPGSTTRAVSVYVGPNGSNSYGYATVMRAVNRGWIERRQETVNGRERQAVYVTAEGRALIEAVKA